MSPQQRDPNAPRRRGRTEQFSDGDIMILDLPGRRCTIYRPSNDESPDDIIIKFSNMSRGGIGLTAMTELELDALQDFFNHAIDLARPGVQRLDKEAEDALRSGDKTFRRLYRPPPVLIDLSDRHVKEDKESANYYAGAINLDRPCSECGAPWLEDHEIGCKTGYPGLDRRDEIDVRVCPECKTPYGGHAASCSKAPS